MVRREQSLWKTLFLGVLVGAGCSTGYILGSFQHSPENTLFAFDLHDVVVKKQPDRIRYALSQASPYTIAFLMAQIINIPLWSSIRTLYYEKKVSGEGFVCMIERDHPYVAPVLVSLIKQIACAYTPNDEMLALIRELQGKGYTITLASNIGPQFYEDLNKKFAQLKAPDGMSYDLDTYFTGGKQVVDFANNGPQKPMFEYYQAYNQTFNKDGQKKVIFIDDSATNVQAANKEGWHGIVYDRHAPDAMQKLKAELARLGIIEQSSSIASSSELE